MSRYNKHVWSSGETITADLINNLETAVAGSAALNGDNAFTGMFSVNGGYDAKQPIGLHATLDGPTVKASGSQVDKVALGGSVTITGDFTGDTGSNPTFLWGQNIFLVTGSTAGDGNGLGDVTASLIEANVAAPAGTTIGTLRGLAAQASFFGPTAGAHVGIIESMRVLAPVRKDGATGGTADTAYGLFVEEVNPTAVGANNGLSLLVAGGVSRFGGRVDVDGQVVAMSGGLTLSADFSAAAQLNLQNAANGGNVTLSLGSTTGLLNVTDSAGATLFVANKDQFLLRDGLPLVVGTTNGTRIGLAANQKLGFHGATPTAQLTGTPAAATDLTTALALVNDLRTKLITKGLIA